MAGGQKRRVEHSEAFLKLAARIVTFPGGDFEPSPPPQLLSKLTDEDLVLAADAVEAVAAKQQQRPTGKAQFRLLAWTVADARGAATPLEKAAAETVGKRLDRQAKKVRADLESCELVYRERRLIASDVDHSSMDEAFRLEIETLRSEVYIGFHELELAVAEDAAAALPAALAAALQVADAPSLHPSQPLPEIPPDLARSLGTTGVQYLWEYAIYVDWATRVYFHGPRNRKSEEWRDLVPKALTKLLSDAAEMPRLQTELEECRDELITARDEQITAHEQVIAHHKTIDLLEQRNRDLEDIVLDQASKLGITDSAVDFHFVRGV
jgi:hypothetical protein